MSQPDSIADVDPSAGAPGRDGEYLSITDRELFDRLGWFTLVRWFFGLFCLLTLLISWYAVGIRFRTADGRLSLTPAVVVVMLILLYNALFTFIVHIVRARRRISRHMIVVMALLQIIADITAISALVHNTGGVENFFLILLLVPIVIATELLPQALAWVTAAGAAVIINALAWCEQQGILPHVRVELAGEAGPVFSGTLYSDKLYVLHVTISLTVAVFALVFVASTIARRLREREAELEGTHRKLQETDETKSFFMRKASHELRAPLSAIHSMLDTVDLLDAGLTPEQEQLIHRIRRRTRGLIELVRDLHRYSMLRTTEGLFTRRDVCLGEIVNNTVELFRQKAREGSVEMTVRSRPIWVTGDEELLREMVTNLVSNAVQYTPAGGRIDVEMFAENEHAVFRVSDTGIGISPRALEHVFEEFYRSSEAKEFFRDGSGLGLAITRRIVQMHGGAVEASPREGKGTVFTVRLPLHRTDNSPPATDR